MELRFLVAAGLVAAVLLFWQIRVVIMRPRINRGNSAPISSYNLHRRQVIERRKDKILKYLGKNRKVTSREVESLLGVSNATATRYLQELVKERHVKEKGKGRSTYYTL